MISTDGYKSPTCTWPLCRYRFRPGGGDGVQHRAPDGTEHRLCPKHHAEYGWNGVDRALLCFALDADAGVVRG